MSAARKIAKAVAVLACALAASLLSGWGYAHMEAWWSLPVFLFFLVLAFGFFLLGAIFLVAAVTEPDVTRAANELLTAAMRDEARRKRPGAR